MWSMLRISFQDVEIDAEITFLRFDKVQPFGGVREYNIFDTHCGTLGSIH